MKLEISDKTRGQRVRLGYILGQLYSIIAVDVHVKGFPAVHPSTVLTKSLENVWGKVEFIWRQNARRDRDIHNSPV